jgi:hypothetical protein
VAEKLSSETGDTMPRGDEDFRDFVCDNLRKQNTRLEALEESQKMNNEITESVHEIVQMGRGFFKFVSNVGHVLGWVGGISAGAAFIWQFISAYFKNSGKGP